MQHSRRPTAGLTIGEVIAIILVLGLLAAVLLPVTAINRHSPRAARCRSRLRQLFQGARMYLINYEEYFPLAWHEGSGATVATVTYARFAIQMATDANVQFREASEGPAMAVELFENNVQFWAGPATGLTNDYFSPPAVFRLPAPDEMVKPYSKHAQYAALTSRVAPASMPFLADVYASTPQPDAKDVPLETRNGIPGAFKRNAFVLGEKPYDAFYGVARSWVGRQPEAKEGSGPQRFDFRHNGSINVIFLDGHVDTIKRNHGDRLKKLHENWNIDSEGAP